MKQVNEAGNQHEMVNLPNGKQAPVLVANLNENIEMVIISKNVLKYLTKLLPKASIWDIIAAHIENVKGMSNPDITKFVAILTAELEFHQSINMIEEYVAESNVCSTEMPVDAFRPKVVS